MHLTLCQLLPMQAIEEALTPRLSITGELSTLTKFKEFFNGRSLEKGTNILLLWKTEGVLEVVAKPESGGADYSQVRPFLHLRCCSKPCQCAHALAVHT